MTASTARALLAAGNVYLGRFANGAPGQPEGPFEASKFAITPKSTQKNAVSKGRDSYGQVIESATIADPSEFEMDLTEINKVTLSMALLGTISAVTQAGGTMTAVAVTADDLDKWIILPHGNLTGAQTVTNSGATVTYVEGTDYIVNEVMGWIKPLSTGSITDGEALKVTSTYGAISGTQIDGMTDAQIRVRAYFDGKNLVDGSPIQATVYELALAASAVFDFLASDFNKVTLKGVMKTPAGYTAPYIVKLLDPA